MLTLPALLLFALPPTPPQEIGLVSERTRLRFTLERVDSDGGTLDLVGAHYDWLEPFDVVPGLYVGIGGFGGVAGDQGGFLSGGVTVGFRQHDAGQIQCLAKRARGGDRVLTHH